MNEQDLKRKLVVMIIIVTLLSGGLAVTSLSLVNSVLFSENDQLAISMGVELTLNEGKPIVDEEDIVYEPGGVYKSEFPIANLGAFDVWYRVYFTNVEGSLKEHITVTVKEKDGTILCRGKMDELSSDKVAASVLSSGEKKILDIEFCFSSEAENEAQGQTVSFHITADAVQKRNNPEKDFGN